MSEATFKSVIMAISVTQAVNGKNQRVFQKFLTYGLPTLADVSTEFPAPDRWAAEEIEPVKGETDTVESPVYDNEHLQWLQDALTQRVQGLARSRDKSGQEPAMDWNALLESAGGGSKYPVLLKEFKEMLSEYLTSKGMTDAQVAAVLGYTNPIKLSEAIEAKQARVMELVNEFKEALDEPAYFGSVFASLERAIAPSEEVDF